MEARHDPGPAPVDAGLDRDPAHCSIARTWAIVGEKWTILIIREAWYGSTRFSDFERVLRCPRSVLAERLRKLVDEGILATEGYQDPGTRTRSRYVITSAGLDLVPTVLALKSWGDRHRAAPQGPAVRSTHRGCGGHVEVSIRCERDHVVRAEDIDSIPGPGCRSAS